VAPVSRRSASLSRATSLPEFRSARERFERSARWLGWIGDAYFICLFFLLPAGFWLWSAEYTLWILLPVLGALHLAAWIALARAHARLLPAQRGDRWKLLIETALYPPSLLRAHDTLRSAAVAPFHPAAVAAVVLPREAARDFLRAEWARAAQRARDAGLTPRGPGLCRRESLALTALLREHGETADALLAAPTRSDPLARSYCPACRCEYRLAGGECSDCTLPLQPFALGDASAPEAR
jgi:hypothetical protein